MIRTQQQIPRRRCLSVAVAVFALIHADSARSETIPIRGLADSRIRTATYDSNQVYRLHGYVGYQIDIQFEPGETFLGLGAGDIEGLSFVSQDNHLFIKPKAAKVSTNLTVLTNRRPYQFDYTASGSHPATGDYDVIFAVRFTYPPVHADAGADALGRMLERSGTSRPRNVDYWYCGSPSVKPIAASDDGIHTRLRFGAKSEQPAIFVQNDDGTESLLNFSMEDGDIVVHRVVRELIVRRGRLAGRIINKAFTGSGERLESGTVSPGVERSARGARP
jgi:type IV secretion system protein VirB9